MRNAQWERVQKVRAEADAMNVRIEMIRRSGNYQEWRAAEHLQGVLLEMQDIETWLDDGYTLEEIDAEIASRSARFDEIIRRML